MNDRSPCPDLKALAAGKYRLKREESYHVEHGKHGRSMDPWLWMIPCQHGHMFPFGSGLLGASTDRRGGIARRLAALPGCRVHQDGDDGLTVVFPEAMFEMVAAILKPRRRRRWSEAQRARAIAEGRLLGVKPRVQIDFGGQTREIAAPVDRKCHFGRRRVLR
jgi:hypothetical protein